MSVGHRTVLAQQAMDASDVIHMTFGKRVIGRNPPRKLVVQVPDGPSTDGGKRARQSIVLAPEGGEGAALMCGWLDLGRRQAELRGFEIVAEQYESRFGHELEVTVQEYRDLMEDLKRTLGNLQVETRFAEAAPPRRSPTASSRDMVRATGDGQNRALLYALLGAIVGVGCAALFFWLR